MKRLITFLIIATLAAVPALAEGPDRGKPEINLDGGRKGEVAFPHALHQDTLPDCQICHKAYPQEPGAIQKLMEEKKLKTQQVMRSCIACHKQRKREKLSFGPTSCGDCHQKK